eukprot:12412470-Karenia_brevis.AAC.1
MALSPRPVKAGGHQWQTTPWASDDKGYWTGVAAPLRVETTMATTTTSTSVRRANSTINVDHVS